MNEILVTESQPASASKAVSGRDPLYLFACHLEWQNERNLRAFEELLAALDDPNEDVRIVAESLLSGHHHVGDMPARATAATGEAAEIEVVNAIHVTSIC